MVTIHVKLKGNSCWRLQVNIVLLVLQFLVAYSY